MFFVLGINFKEGGEMKLRWVTKVNNREIKASILFPKLCLEVESHYCSIRMNEGRYPI